MYGVTDHGGRATIGPFAPGSLKLAVSASGFDSLTREIEIGPGLEWSCLDLVLDPTSSIVVECVDKQGEPVGDAAVWIVPASVLEEVQPFPRNLHDALAVLGDPVFTSAIGLTEPHCVPLGKYVAVGLQLLQRGHTILPEDLWVVGEGVVRLELAPP